MSLPSRSLPWLLMGWFAVVVAWTRPSLSWQLEYFRTPGPAFYQAMVVAAPAVLLLSLAYAWLRRKTGLRRIEPWALLALIGLVLLLRPLAAIAAAVVALSCFAIGGRAFRLARIPAKATIESVFLRFSLGFAVASALLFWPGMAGWFSFWLFVALAAGLCLWRWRDLAEPFTVLRSAVRSWWTVDELAHPAVGVAVFFVLLASLSGVALLLAPPIAYDAVNYHLPLAKAYSVVGALQAAAQEPYSFYPQGFETLLSWAYALGGLESSRLLAVLFFALALTGVWAVARRLEASPAAAFVGLAAAIVMPAVHFTGVTVKNDSASACYCLGALLCYFRWCEERRQAWLLVGFVFVASAFGVKHTALFPAVGLAPLGLHALWQNRGARLRLAAATVSIWLLAAGVWHLRAWILTGNPTYPYNAGRMTAAAIEGNAGAGASAAKPWDVLWSVPQTFLDLHRDGSLVYESILPAPAGVFLALLLPAPLLLRPRHKYGTAAGVFVYGSLTVWAVAMATLRTSVNADMTLRYVLPAFLLWPVLLASPALGMYERFPRPARAAMLMALAYSFVLPWTGLLIIENSGAQARYLAGRMSERDYLAGAMLPFAAIEAAAHAARPGDAALSFHGCASLFYPEPWRFRCLRPGNWGDPVETITAELARDDFRFLILRSQEASYAKQLPVSVEPVFRDEHYVAFRVKSR